MRQISLLPDVPFLVSSLVPSLCLLLLLSGPLPAAAPQPSPLLAGAAKVDITDYDAGPVNDPLFAKAVAVKSGTEMIVFVSVDAVAIGEIGRIKNDYLPTVRSRLEK